MRLNLLSLQPALRTLTSDYNCLKKQVQDFPFMLEKAITEAKQEVSERSLRLLLLLLLCPPPSFCFCVDGAHCVLNGFTVLMCVCVRSVR